MYRIYSEGIIEAITGPMFSGKSEELIKRIRILGFSKIKTLVVKPAIDSRWDKEKIISRSGSSISTLSAKTIEEIEDAFKNGNFKAIAIDEVQFFDKKIVDIISRLANNKIRVIVSGLDKDFKGNPFGPMPDILSIADIVDKQAAACQRCGKAATMTYRKSDVDDIVVIGDQEYEPRCRGCHAIR